MEHSSSSDSGRETNSQAANATSNMNSNGDAKIKVNVKDVSGLSKARRRVYSREQLTAYDLLDGPIWVFDIANTAMWWANEGACDLWGAPDSESLCQRDFASDMSTAAVHSLNDWLESFRQGKTKESVWTIHPNGGKDGPKTCDMFCSGIFVSETGKEEDRHLCMMVVVGKVTDGKLRAKEDAEAIRQTEMFRHFPIVARQFNHDGNLMDQNPEAWAAFGTPPSQTRYPPPKTQKSETSEVDSQTNTKEEPASSDAKTVQNDMKRLQIDDQEEGNAQDQNGTHNQGSSGGVGLELKNGKGTCKPEANKPSATTNTDTSQEHLCDFLSLFVNIDEGKQVFDEVRQGHDYSTETQQITIDGPKWFTVNVRSIKDAVSSEPIIIYSARDITKVMISAKQEAEKQNMKRSEFFAVMAHEIRTPLHQVVGFIELLAASGLNPEQTELVDMLQTSAHALMAIINDLLDFTKLAAGKMKLETIPFEVRGVLDGSVAAVQPQVNEKGLVVRTHVNKAVPLKLMGDPNRLRQIVLNMLSNAVKFTSRGEISLESKVAQQADGKVTVRFSIADTGIGIPEAKCERIFNAYQQADVSVSRNYGGTGLGLAICKNLVENMGGSIGVESKLGHGATFWFEIPFGQFVKGNQTEDAKEHVDDHNELACLRILVAEDNKVNQKVVCRMLSRLGHEPVVAHNGQEALTEITNAEKKYDLVLMDWQMPVMDGIDATKEIRHRGYSMEALPIVGLTASIQNVDWLAIGMNDCLKKPIRISDLKAALVKNSR